MSNQQEFPYLASPTSGPVCHVPKSSVAMSEFKRVLSVSLTSSELSEFQVVLVSRRFSDKRKNSEVEDRRPPAITTTVELPVPAVVEFW